MDIRTCFYAIAGVPAQSSSFNGVCIYANGTWKKKPHDTKRNVMCGGNGEWAYQYFITSFCGWPTPLHLILNVWRHRGLLVVYVFVLHLLSNSPEWSPLLWNKRGTGSRLITRPGVFEIPVKVWLVHSFGVGFTNAFITSPLQVLYTRRSGSAYHRGAPDLLARLGWLQGSSQYGM